MRYQSLIANYYRWYTTSIQCTLHIHHIVYTVVYVSTMKYFRLIQRVRVTNQAPLKVNCNIIVVEINLQFARSLIVMMVYPTFSCKSGISQADFQNRRLMSQTRLGRIESGCYKPPPLESSQVKQKVADFFLLIYFILNEYILEFNQQSINVLEFSQQI